jgi:hypothetical protein
MQDRAGVELVAGLVRGGVEVTRNIDLLVSQPADAEHARSRSGASECCPGCMARASHRSWKYACKREDAENALRPDAPAIPTT